jgi:hypothetical protein
MALAGVFIALEAMNNIAIMMHLYTVYLIS